MNAIRKLLVVGALCGGGMAGASEMFVTRATFAGDLGGLAGADAKCQLFAEAAGFDGAWVAWLSDSSHDAFDRITGNGPWVNGWGLEVFVSKAQLRGFPNFVMGYDEYGHALDDPYIWTGTNLTGVRDEGGSFCMDWTDGSYEYGHVGNANADDESWTSLGYLSCYYERRLLCLQQ
jgi:hypothetical protein